MKVTGKTLLVAGIILVAALSRLLPHLPNFTPIAAMALFGGVMIQNRFYAMFLPLLALLISDLMLEAVFSNGFYTGQWTVYLSFACIVLIGRMAGTSLNAGKIGAASLAGTSLFFLITNFGSWLGNAFYPQNFTGLLMSYEAGIPFYGYSILGDLFYSTLIFGSWALLKNRVPALQEVRN